MSAIVYKWIIIWYLSIVSCGFSDFNGIDLGWMAGLCTTLFPLLARRSWQPLPLRSVRCECRSTYMHKQQEAHAPAQPKMTFENKTASSGSQWQWEIEPFCWLSGPSHLRDNTKWAPFRKWGAESTGQSLNIMLWMAERRSETYRDVSYTKKTGANNNQHTFTLWNQPYLSNFNVFFGSRMEISALPNIYVSFNNFPLTGANVA